MIEKPLSYYLKKSKTIDLENSNFKKIAFLSNFTLQGLSSVLQVISNQYGMNIHVYESPYNQYRQEIIDMNSNWNKFNSDMSFLILDFESLIGSSIYDYHSYKTEERKELIDKTCLDVINLVESILKHQNGIIVISTFLLPTFSPLGIYESKMKYPLKEFVIKLNQLLFELSTKHDSLFCLEMDNLFQKFGSENMVDEKLKYLADMKISPDKFEHIANDMLSFLIPLFGKTKKCLVLDLDNTLWGGIVGEDGINGIKLDSKSPGNSFLEFQKVILQLNQRGVILAINSKNNLSDVIEVFEKHPNMILKENHFASMKINWNDKASNISSIAGEINVGIDSMVFWDDDPVNRELIRQKFPDVFVVDVPKDTSLYAKTLRTLPLFNSFQLTNEDMKKGQIYAAQRQRKTHESSFTNIDDFLSSLEMEVECENANEFTINRISQLVMKTNQFNLTSKRYSDNEIKKMAFDDNYIIRTFSVIDKFGDNGLIGLYIIKKISTKEWIIDSFLLSCRIMGRNMENLMLNDILQLAQQENIEKIEGEYIKSPKNSVTKDLYTKYGFRSISDTKFVLDNISNFILNQLSYIKSKNK
jgi:FkbH-like protein